MLQLIEDTYKHSHKEPYGCSIYDFKDNKICNKPMLISSTCEVEGTRLFNAYRDRYAEKLGGKGS